ncbi:long-chain-fatty-acid--CoA ligase [Mycolicibacterium murale]|uniref:Long-chain-fatty-acid--CoA ligase FadD13 n=1 Tax=Mycolicibacterium murale TaxID=182220 RepID=A0A7I9WT68_9MYCO|nr:long-chain-fatty-acid--CoA ligase [Mycolicibacterium murale]
MIDPHPGAPVPSTMQTSPLTLTAVVRSLQERTGRTEILTCRNADGDVERTTHRDLLARVGRVANHLQSAGVRSGNRVATLLWNTAEHLELYVAVPAMGAVLHTLNPRMKAAQLAFVIDEAGDDVLVCDSEFADLVTEVLSLTTRVHTVLVVGAAPQSMSRSGRTVLDYATATGLFPAEFDWPELDENAAASICYTSGTTGDPKGVVYSHRSIHLHALASCTANSVGISSRDTVMPLVPMFHVNAWGLPYAALMAGAQLVLPGRHVRPQTIAALLDRWAPTVSGAVPTVWTDLLAFLRSHPGHRLTSLRRALCGGASASQSLVEAYHAEWGVSLTCAWGMTETSPIVAIADPPPAAPTNAVGRVGFGVRARVVDDSGTVLPRDGAAVGELEVSGPWITGGYLAGRGEDSFRRDCDGTAWLRTGDLATIDDEARVVITDRVKDVIKSGGEWISSVALESELCAHPAVREAAVIGVRHERWDERPVALVVLAQPDTVSADELRAWLEPRVPRWWIPETVIPVAQLARTSTGKTDKRALREAYAKEECHVDGGR